MSTEWCDAVIKAAGPLLRELTDEEIDTIDEVEDRGVDEVLRMELGKACVQVLSHNGVAILTLWNTQEMLDIGERDAATDWVCALANCGSFRALAVVSPPNAMNENLNHILGKLLTAHLAASTLSANFETILKSLLDEGKSA